MADEAAFRVVRRALALATRCALAMPVALLAHLLCVSSLLVAPRFASVAPRRIFALAAAADAAEEPAVSSVNISWREESYAEPVVPSVSLTRSRDGTTGTATFRFERPQVLSLHDVWDNGLITGLWLQDEEGQLRSTDLTLEWTDGRPSDLVAILVLKSVAEWERFMRFMKRYAAANDLGFERSPTGSEAADKPG